MVQFHQPLYNITPFQDVDKNDTSAILRAADLDWSLVLKPCLYHDENNDLIIGSKRYLLISRGGVLSEMTVVGRDYKCIQPINIIELFQKTDKIIPLNLISAGHTRDGKYIYVIGEIIGANLTPTEESLSLNKCIMMSVCNDGNGKLKVTPVMMTKTGSQLRLTQGDKATPLTYELSHHFDFDGDEVLFNIKENIIEMFDIFSNEIEFLNSIPLTSDTLDEFCHQIFKRFNIGNEKTKRNYDKTLSELKEHYKLLSVYYPKATQGTMFSLYLFFCDYLDFSKTRKSGINGRIHSINFGHDSVSKNTAFKIIYKLAKEA
ncbi:DUF932 domain-containing protein [Photobacterium damselae]|uniref:DUF932 domain-containing protein n=1 Tax=Photobacterium damselae TaxID=38293 RepID=UPI004067E080